MSSSLPLRLVAGLGLAAAVTFAADSAPRRLYFANDDHTDYMWTANEATYGRVLNEMLDYYLDLADATATNPPEHQSRWHADGSFWIWNYERTHSPDEMSRLIGRIRDGHIAFPLNALVSCYGAQPTEAVLRGMLYAGSVERRYDLRVPMAIAMENQTLPYGLGALWAGSGAQYSWKGICGCATKFDPKRERPHEIYWWKNDDGSRILMKWNTKILSFESFGSYAEGRNLPRTLKLIEDDADFNRRWPYAIVGVFGRGEDDLKTLSDEFVRFAQANTTPKHQIVVSNENDFFADFARTYGKDLPEFNASFGNEWDLYSATLSEVSAKVRRAVEELRAAESLAALVALEQPAFLERRREARDRAWMHLGMFWEHDWTADGPVVTRQARADWQRRLADQIHGYVDELARDSAAMLGGMIARTGQEPRFYVFNPLGWTRSAAADLPYEGPADVHVVEVASGREVPAQIVELPQRDYFAGVRHLRIWATDLPSVGYKTYEIRPGQGAAEFPVAATWTGGRFENPFFQLEVRENGAITRLVDKRRNGRQFARVGGLNDLGVGTGAMAVENAGPVSVTLKIACTAPLAHNTRITLYRESDRIDVDNEITQNFGDIQQWGFAFNLEEPDVHHEEVGAILHARLTTDGGHYSPVNSRLDWLTLNHFVAVSGRDGVGMTISNRDCAFFQLGRSTMENRQPVLDTTTPEIHVLAGGMIDAGLGIYNQGGDSYFLQRFALSTYDRYDAVAAMKMSLEHQNSPVAAGIRGSAKARYPETTFSLATVSDPGVLLWALKPAEDGPQAGLVARLWNVGSTPRDTRFALAGGIASATHTTHLETYLSSVTLTSGELSAHFEKTQLQTFRLVPVRP